MRALKILVAAVAAVLSQVVAGAVVAAEPPSPCLVAPVHAPVLDPFRQPACTWCPGNRGLEYGTAPGTVARAAGSGRVSFAGVVAGTRYVVVEHPSGLRTTYGRLASISVVSGTSVTAGTPVGVTAGRLFFGVRRGDVYLDPAGYLLQLVRRARLVPTNGGPRLPAKSVVVSCRARR